MFNLLAAIAISATLTVYSETGIITDVDTASDLVEVTTLGGEIYAFYGAEDWQNGDICSMLMDSKGTPEITDDEIIRSFYNGNLDQFITRDEPGVQVDFFNGNGYWYDLEEGDR